ncbi:hypothetical protein MMC24_005705 [Lignoscripta atroalba]|nr:hypothetical protein [Lignoscripta atroalba]
MRDLPKTALSLGLLVVSWIHTAAAIDLSDFQKIAGFSAACTNAYNTPINGCTASDFTSRQPCSTRCVRCLETITNVIISACEGTKADPTTLIGMFFTGEGVNALCPNVGAPASMSMMQSNGPTASMITSISQTTTPTEETTASLSVLTSTSLLVETTPSMSITTSQSTELPSSDAVPSSSTRSQSSLATANSSSSATSEASSTTAIPTSSSSAQSTESTTATVTVTSSPSASFIKTAVNGGSATVITSKPDQTSSSNPDSFGGGGSPFEISNGLSGANTVEIAWRLLGVVVFTVLAWLW